MMQRASSQRLLKVKVRKRQKEPRRVTKEDQVPVNMKEIIM